MPNTLLGQTARAGLRYALELWLACSLQVM